MKLPIVLVERATVSDVYDAVADVERDLEAYDVANLEAFDSSGQRLELVPLSTDRIKVSESRSPVKDEVRLREALIRSLAVVGVEPTTTSTLAELVDLTRRHYLSGEKRRTRRSIFATLSRIRDNLLKRRR